MDYDYKDILRNYRKLGIKKGSTVLFKSDFYSLGFFASKKKEDILNAHFEALSKLIDFSKGTLVVMSSSTYLCNTDIPFDIFKTKSERGVFSEFVRCKTESERSFHPFMSYSAIGFNAKKICGNVSNHSWGENTPKKRLIDLNALCLSVGIEPNLTCSTVHQIEYEIGVPYRFSKMFYHPIKFNNKIIKEKFYMYVLYKKLKIKRNRNRKIFEFILNKGFKINEVKLGKGFAYSYNLKDFYRYASEAFRKDIFIWLDENPNLKSIISG